MHAQDKFARNVISLPKSPDEVQVEGEATIVFLGANGQRRQITCPKVSSHCCQADGRCQGRGLGRVRAQSWGVWWIEAATPRRQFYGGTVGSPRAIVIV